MPKFAEARVSTIDLQSLRKAQREVLQATQTAVRGIFRLVVVLQARSTIHALPIASAYIVDNVKQNTPEEWKSFFRAT